jgi:PAS domain S-box-containing protein
MSGGLPDDFLARLTQDSPDAIIYADAQGAIRFWNSAATRIFGFTEGEALGARLDFIIPERLRTRHWEGYDAVMSGAQSRYGAGALLAVPALHKDGRQISVEFTISAMHDETGKLLGIAAYLRDATARFEEMRALRREIAALKGNGG